MQFVKITTGINIIFLLISFHLNYSKRKSNQFTDYKQSCCTQF